jgi:hypothetical protein
MRDARVQLRRVAGASLTRSRPIDIPSFRRRSGALNFLVIILLIICIAMPLGYAWRIWRLHEPSLGAWLAIVTEGILFVALVFIVGRWDMAGYYTRLPLLASRSAIASSSRSRIPNASSRDR